ncbi:MAG: sel1 repeat family protein [Firmicutes bacterium]|nr:sel1 repeat family protein [Bacillota bacterium]
MINFDEELEKAKNGDGVAAYIVAACYLEGLCGAEESINQCLKWRKRGIKMNNNALHIFIRSYIYSDNRKKAKKFFDLSFAKVEEMANQGEMCSQSAIADYHQLGYMGNRIDYDKAANLYEKSAAQGYPHAQYSIGLFYLEGKGVKLDVKKSIEWFDKAIANGCKDSILERQKAVTALRSNGVGSSSVPQSQQQLTELKCLACGGTIELQNNFKKGFCLYCNTKYVAH